MSFEIPLARIPLGQTPTPLEAQPTLLSALLGPGHWPSLWCKRDDLTGVSVTGNKVRKLEYLVAQAKQLGADTLLTCGGIQSNHCRATAAVAAQQGLSAQLFLRHEGPQPAPTGNLLLDRLLGAQVTIISRADYQRRDERMEQAAQTLRLQGRRGYVIPEGGSNGLGCLGYVRCIDELLAQVQRPHEPLTIVSAVGSGGTLAGLIVGALLRKLPWRIVGINVCDDRAYFVRRISAILKEAAALLHSPPELAPIATDVESLIDLRDGYVGRGYALSQPAELRVIAHVAQRSGLLLDPVYTGKAFYGLLEELRADVASLGERVVFLHSGGVFGLLAASEDLAQVVGDA